MTSSRKKDSSATNAPASDVLLIFDMDGTLLDAREAVIDAVREGLSQTYQHFRLPVPNLDRARIAGAIGLPSPAFFRAACDSESVPPDIWDRFIGEFEVRSTRAEVAALTRGETELYEGAEPALQELVDRGHPLALFSNANELYFEAVIRAHRLERFFQQRFSLEQAIRQRVARNKTGIVSYLSSGTRPAVVIGDRVHDIDAGRASGAVTVGCLYGFGEPAEFDAADWTINRFGEILELPLAGSTLNRNAADR